MPSSKKATGKDRKQGSSRKHSVGGVKGTITPADELYQYIADPNHIRADKSLKDILDELEKVYTPEGLQKIKNHALQIAVENKQNGMVAELLTLKADGNFDPYILEKAIIDGSKEIVYTLVLNGVQTKINDYMPIKRAISLAIKYANDDEKRHIYFDIFDTLVHGYHIVSTLNSNDVKILIRYISLKYQENEEDIKIITNTLMERATAEGGARITYQGKSYKLCTEKDTGKKYITVGKEKTRVYVRTSSKGTLSFRKA